jgi:hypothetical protein
LQLNPNHPAWYNQAFRFAYFFDGQFDKSLKYAKLVTEPFAADYGYFAAAMTDDIVSAKAAAAEVARLHPDWSVEQYLSDSGGYLRI